MFAFVLDDFGFDCIRVEQKSNYRLNNQCKSID